MPRRRAITFAESAVGDLEEIRDWYDEQQFPAAGKKLIGEIIAQIERVADFPDSGRIVPEFGVANLRETILPPFRVVCRLDDRRIRIVRVWRSERLLRLSESEG
jgi:plasmid stabilization system protein ParE